MACAYCREPRFVITASSVSASARACKRRALAARASSSFSGCALGSVRRGRFRPACPTKGATVAQPPKVPVQSCIANNQIRFRHRQTSDHGEATRPGEWRRRCGRPRLGDRRQTGRMWLQTSPSLTKPSVSTVCRAVLLVQAFEGAVTTSSACLLNTAAPNSTWNWHEPNPVVPGCPIPDSISTV